MAVQKTKKKELKNFDVFKWTPQRKKAALLLSVGTKTNEAVAEEVQITVQTLWNWRQYPDFLEEIDKLTLKNENFTRAGLLKHCLKGLEIKEHNISNDRNTFLDYIQEIADIQGMKKQQVEHSGQIVVNLVRASCRKENVSNPE